MVLAHAGHWLVNLIYVMPVAIIVGALTIQNVRDKRAERRDEENDRP